MPPTVTLHAPPLPWRKLPAPPRVVPAGTVTLPSTVPLLASVAPLGTVNGLAFWAVTSKVAPAAHIDRRGGIDRARGAEGQSAEIHVGGAGVAIGSREGQCPRSGCGQAAAHQRASRNCGSRRPAALAVISVGQQIDGHRIASLESAARVGNVDMINRSIGVERRLAGRGRCRNRPQIARRGRQGRSRSWSP